MTLSDEYNEFLEVPPGVEVWSCETVESTALQVGETSWWFRTTSLFARDKHSGRTELVADIPFDRAGCLEVAEKPVPVKFLLSPLRQEYGGPGINADAFES